MSKTSHQALARIPGMTLLEISVVIMVLLSMITTFFIGAHGWKRGSDRALCIMNIEHVQRGVRGFGNMNGLNPGDIVPDLEPQVIRARDYVVAMPACPGNGSYSTLGDQIPNLGELYLSCSLAPAQGHLPPDSSSW